MSDKKLRREKLANMVGSVFQNSYEDTVYFAKAICNIDIYPEKQDYVRDKSNIIIVRAGRKWGKTKSTAIKALHYAWFSHLHFAEAIEKTGSNITTILCIAPTKDQAEIIFSDIKEVVDNSMLLDWKASKDSKTKMELYFADKSGKCRILVRAAGIEGKSVRGYPNHVLIIDEAAFVNDAVYTAAVFNLIGTGGKIIMVSTPFGKNGFYYRMSEKTRDGNGKVEAEYIKDDALAVQYKGSSYDNPLVRNHRELIEALTEGMTEGEIETEIMANFIDMGDSYFSYAKVLKAFGDINWKSVKGRVKLYMGVDIAKFGKDDTVVTIIAVDKNKHIFLVEQRAYNKTTNDDVIEIIETTNMRYKKAGWQISRAFIDDTGLSGVADGVKRKKILPCVGHIADRFSVIELYRTTRVWIEREMIQLGTNKTLIKQMMGVKKKYVNERIGIDKESVKKDKSKHDDYVDSLNLAMLAVSSDGWFEVLTDTRGQGQALDDLMDLDKAELEVEVE